MPARPSTARAVLPPTRPVPCGAGLMVTSVEAHLAKRRKGTEVAGAAAAGRRWVARGAGGGAGAGGAGRVAAGFGGGGRGRQGAGGGRSHGGLRGGGSRRCGR